MSTQADIVKTALDRFPNMGSRTLAKYLLNNYGVEFDNNLERIRNKIRYYRGTCGTKNRNEIAKVSLKSSPSDLPRTWRRTRTPYKLSAGLWLIAPDIHVPFHEPRPIESMIKYAQTEKINGIFFPGDLQDCQAVSFWPSAKRDIDAEIEAMADFLNFMTAEFPKAQLVWLPGNHEYRLPRYYMHKAPELAGSIIGSVCMDVALNLEGRGVEFLDYNQMVLAGKLPILHGHEFKISRAVNPARGLFLKAKTFAMCAHHHSSSEHTEKDLNGNILTTWSTGCLCDLSPDYQPYANWNWGFALVNAEKNGDFEVINKRILPSGQVV